MNVLLTGVTGYIGKRLLPILIQNGHFVFCCVRDKNRFTPPPTLSNFIKIIEVDFLKENTLNNIPKNIDVAYYLIHSMSGSGDYKKLEAKAAYNFKHTIQTTNTKQVIYLSGIVNQNNLSKHLSSRKNVEEQLKSDLYKLTTFRAGIIIGSGSASFEIIRDLVEKLPIMVAPKWLKTKCQPIGIRDVIKILNKALLNPQLYNQNYDIGGPNILTYKQMLLLFAKFRKLNRKIYTVPVMTPKLSSYWLYFVTSTNYRLASSLVESMSIDVICRNDHINKILNIYPENYIIALDRAFRKIEANNIVSSWKDAQISGVKKFNISDFIKIPSFGCFKDIRKRKITSSKKILKKIWSIGGKNGWYHANFLWQLRGFIDKIAGGVGLRRGRTSQTTLKAGDALDFWRVLYANKEEGRLLLFAEMKLPGEAWLEFHIKNNELIQTATFRPNGVLGRLYWYSILPLHGIIFKGMIDKIVR